MVYLIQKTYGNAYRCCCYSSWDAEPLWEFNRLRALDYVKPVRTEYWPDYELVKITVTDTVTNTLVAVGELSWGETRETRYSQYSWKGHIDGVLFEDNKP